MSLLVVWIVASIPLWFLFPDAIIHIWAIAVGLVGLVGIVIIVAVKVMERDWIGKLIRFPGRYAKWLFEDVRREKAVAIKSDSNG